MLKGTGFVVLDAHRREALQFDFIHAELEQFCSSSEGMCEPLIELKLLPHAHRTWDD